VNHSSKSNPCPVCDRTKDDKCRWNDNFIFCYRGDSFAPPDLRLGQVLEVPGWPRLAVVAEAGGFAGASVVLAPDEGREALQAPRRPGESVACSTTAKVLMSKIRAQLRILLSQPEFECLTIAQLRALGQEARNTRDLVLDLGVFVRHKRGLIKKQRQLQLNLRDSEKTLKYFLADLAFFIKNNLGCSFSYDH
jgi:hypothetical protein